MDVKRGGDMRDDSSLQHGSGRDDYSHKNVIRDSSPFNLSHKFKVLGCQEEVLDMHLIFTRFSVWPPSPKK